MKSKYLFLRDGLKFSPETVAYQVWVGTSRRELTKFKKFSEWCAAHGSILWPWDDMCDSLLWYHADEIFTKLGLLNFGFTPAGIDLKKALQLANDDSWAKFESRLTQPIGTIDFLRQSNPRRFLVQSAKKYAGRAPERNTSARRADPKPRRRYLSPSVIRFL